VNTGSIPGSASKKELPEHLREAISKTKVRIILEGEATTLEEIPPLRKKKGEESRTFLPILAQCRN